MTIQIWVDNRVRILKSVLSGTLDDRLKDSFTHENPKKEDDGFAYYRTFEEVGEHLTFPRGGMSRIRQALRDHSISFTVIDNRCSGDRKFLDNDWGGKPIPKHDVTLWQWQEEATDLIFAKQNCILRAATGAGKSTAALYVVTMMNVPTIISVPTANLVEQWVERVVKEMGIAQKEIGIVGMGKRKTAPITIATQDMLAEGIREEWLKAFGAFIFDEIHRSSSRTIYPVCDAWPAKYRIGMSATVERHDKKEFLIYDLFGDVAADIKKEDVIAAKHIVDVEIRLVPTELRAPWYKAATMSKNQFHLRAAHRKLLEVMWNDKHRNALIEDIVKDEVKDGNQVMVLSLRREHCLMMDRNLVGAGIKSGVMLGGAASKEQFRKTKEGIREGKMRVIVGTIAAIGTGQDFPTVSCGVVTMPISNNKQLMEQVKGRFCRACEEIGKTKGTMYYIFDQFIFGKRPLENFCKWNKVVSVWDGTQWVPGKEYLEMMGSMVKKKAASGPISLDEMMGDNDDE